jgi:hypothetical protein
LENVKTQEIEKKYKNGLLKNWQVVWTYGMSWGVLCSKERFDEYWNEQGKIKD